MALYLADLLGLAAQHIAHSRRILVLHRPDGTGCCTRCGRLYPCDAVQVAEQLMSHYRDVAGERQTGGHLEE